MGAKLATFRDDDMSGMLVSLILCVCVCVCVLCISTALMAVETSNPYVPTYRLVPVSTEQRFTSESDTINTVNQQQDRGKYQLTPTHTHTHTHTHSTFKHFSALYELYTPSEGEQRSSIIDNGYINPEVTLPVQHILDNLPQMKVRHTKYILCT